MLTVGQLYETLLVYMKKTWLTAYDELGMAIPCEHSFESDNCIEMDFIQIIFNKYNILTITPYENMLCFESDDCFGELTSIDAAFHYEKLTVLKKQQSWYL